LGLASASPLVIGRIVWDFDYGSKGLGFKTDVDNMLAIRGNGFL